MVRVITAADRRPYGDLLADMYRDRKKVFVDRLGWGVGVVDGQFEIDQFDIDEAVYLVVTDPSERRHLGSVRLLPSTGPNLLTDIFPHLCNDGPPSASNVWEITRLCTAPDLDDPAPVRRQIMLALAEFALLSGIARYTCVTHMAFLSSLLAIGWDCEPLGLPAQSDDQMVGALSISITPATLAMLRAKTGAVASTLVWPSQFAA